MALVKCKECGREISEHAPTCPGCGAPMAVALGVPAAWVTPAPPQPTPEPPIAPAPAPSQGAPSLPAKSTSGFPVLLTIVIPLVFVLIILRQCAASSSSTTEAAPTVAAPAPAEQTAEERKQLISDLAAGMESTTSSPLAQLGYAESLIRLHPGTPEAKRAAELLEGLKATVAEINRGRQWTYNAYEDEMSSKTTYSGSVKSNDTFEFEFPYTGQQKSTLTLRRHPRWGTDIMFSIENGQILCSSYDCPVRVRFDDGPAQTLSGTEPSDNSSEYVFVPGYAAFARKLEKAKRVKIEVNIYQHGLLVSEFDVEGFKPENLRAKK